MSAFRKTDSRPGRIAYEVAGLAWLAAAGPSGAPVVPVLAHGPTWLEEPRLRAAAPTAGAAEEFGRALARTHAAGAAHLGAPPPGHSGDGWMGQAPLTLPARPEPVPRSGPAAGKASATGRGSIPEGADSPAPTASWGSFYARERIAPYLGAPAFTAAERALIERLCGRLESGALDHDQPRLVAEAAAASGQVGAARTHGDLWSGNVMWTPEGAVLIDPAAQGGHAEEDLAALAVFGCPHLERITAAYHEASPLADGWRERTGLHQMHIIMIHCFLFGRSYVPEATAIARRYA